MRSGMETLRGITISLPRKKGYLFLTEKKVIRTSCPGKKWKNKECKKYSTAGNRTRNSYPLNLPCVLLWKMWYVSANY